MLFLIKEKLRLKYKKMAMMKDIISILVGKACFKNNLEKVYRIASRRYVK